MIDCRKSVFDSSWYSNLYITRRKRIMIKEFLICVFLYSNIFTICKEIIFRVKAGPKKNWSNVSRCNDPLTNTEKEIRKKEREKAGDFKPWRLKDPPPLLTCAEHFRHNTPAIKSVLNPKALSRIKPGSCTLRQARAIPLRYATPRGLSCATPQLKSCLTHTFTVYLWEIVGCSQETRT